MERTEPPEGQRLIHPLDAAFRRLLIGGADPNSRREGEPFRLAAYPSSESYRMRIIRPFTRAADGGMRALVQGIIQTSDALIGLTGRMNDRFEAHWSERTKLLRAHYADRANQGAKPLPVVDGPIDLSLRGGVREAA